MAKSTTRKKASRKKASRRGSKPSQRRRSAKTSSAAGDDSIKARAGRIYRTLSRTYPAAECALTHENPFQLLVATILSAQCTDERVNMVTPELFARYPDPPSLAEAPQKDVEKLIQSTGFFRNKAKNLRGAAQRITDEHGGQVPDDMEQLLRLPGVARKTANVVLGNAFGKNVGVVVDTHVRRLSRRLGLTEHTDPTKIERDLMAAFPRPKWAMLSHLLIFHGRQICNARKPDCPNCPLADDCPQVDVTVTTAGPLDAPD